MSETVNYQATMNVHNLTYALPPPLNVKNFLYMMSVLQVGYIELFKTSSK